MTVWTAPLRTSSALARQLVHAFMGARSAEERHVYRLENVRAFERRLTSPRR